MATVKKEQVMFIGQMISSLRNKGTAAWLLLPINAVLT